jgi:hypothetical protein
MFMKKISPLFILVFVIFFSACKKNNTAEAVLNEMTDSTAMPVYNGAFMNGPYGTVAGNVKIFRTDTSNTLMLMDLSSSNGPDLRVYISKEMYPVNFIDLGALKATGGNQVYNIPGLVDFTQYKYALIHCRQYNHLFGWALLQ